MLFLAWPLVWISLAVFVPLLLVARIAAIIMAAVLFGRKPVSKLWSFDTNRILGDYAPIQRWPKWRGHRILPGAILVIGSALFFVGSLVYDYPRTIGALLLLWGLFIGCSIFLDSQIWQVTREYIRAKTKKVCPHITFTD